MKKPKVEETSRLYYQLQMSGWLLFFIIMLTFGSIWYEFDGRLIANYLNVAFFGFLISHFFRNYVKKNRWSSMKLSQISVRLIVSPVLLALLWEVFILPVSMLLYSNLEISGLFVASLTLNLSMVYFVWALIYFFYKLFKSYKQSEIEKWRLRAAVKDAQLIALKSQINPHFIFNCLNNIRSLVVENPEKSRDMITHLSTLLRYSIQFNTTEKVNLKDELLVVKNYLNLESIQFEDRLKFNIDIDKQLLEYKIPPMAIQLLVENAIKHGISKLPEGGEINIMGTLKNDKLHIEVVNTGKLDFKPATSSGIGIKNATERLQILFGKISKIDLKNIDNNKVSASFSIPLRT